MSKKYKITESTLKNAVKSVVTEFLNRDGVDAMVGYGLNDPTEENVVNEEELKQKCDEFVQKTNEYLQYFQGFYQYIDGVEEDAENGVEAKEGVRQTIRSRNSFGARDLHDEYLEENLTNLAKSLNNLQYAANEAIESVESI